MLKPYESVEREGTLEISMPSDLDVLEQVVGEALRFVQTHTERSFEVFPFKLALYESLTNAIKHGNYMDTRLTVKLTVSVSDTSIGLCISDSGEGFDWKEAMSKSKVEVMDPGGRGLLLLNAYNCHPAYNEKGNILTMRLDLSGK